MRIALLVCATTVITTMTVSSIARADEPTTLECLGAHEESLALQGKHQLRAARQKLLSCSSSACPADVRAECMQKVQELNAQVPTIVFETVDADGRDLVAVSVTMDGERLTDRLEGTSIAVDPGQHTFIFEWTGHPTIERTLVVHEGEQDRHERVAWPPAPTPVAPVAPSVTANEIARPAPPPAPASRWGRARIAGLALAGAGVIAVGIGTFYGIEAWSTRDGARTGCRANPCTGPDAEAHAAQWNEAVSQGNKSTIAFVGGAVGLAAGAALWFIGRPHDGATPLTAVAVGPGGLTLAGRW
jgi:serine/threonine-protein kinase